MGVSTMKTANPVVRASGTWNHGWYLGLTTRLGRDLIFGKLGIEMHKIELAGTDRFAIISGLPAAYFLKLPFEAGLRIWNTDRFGIRVTAGLQLSYTAKIEQNDLGLDHHQIRDFSYGAKLGSGLDFGAFCIDLGYEWGISELYTNTKHQANFWFLGAGFFF